MRRLSFLLSLAVALGLLACGKGESAEDKIAGALHTAFTKTNPESCTTLMTQAYLEQSFRMSGTGAVEACEQNARAEESDNPAVEVSHLEIDDATAAADVTPEGDAQTLRLALVEEDGDWKLDEIVRIVGFDRGAFLRDQRKGLEVGETRPDPEAAKCILDAFREMPRPQLEKILLGGSAVTEAEVYERCERP